MGRRILVHPEFLLRVPGEWEAWSKADGSVVTRSGATETLRVQLGGVDLHLKRYRYGPRGLLKGSLRHRLGRSRAGAEFRMLGIFRERAGTDVTPAPVAYGERRCCRLVREAFLATETVPGARSALERVPADRGAARELGAFLRRLHQAGLRHGGLFSRNLLVTEDGGFRVVDVDRARITPPSEIPMAARDLACLDESLPEVPRSQRLRTLRAYLGGSPDRSELREWLKKIDAPRESARERLRRRNRLRGPRPD